MKKSVYDIKYLAVSQTVLLKSIDLKVRPNIVIQSFHDHSHRFQTAKLYDNLFENLVGMEIKPPVYIRDVINCKQKKHSPTIVYIILLF